jgi:hypothetical protein
MNLPCGVQARKDGQQEHASPSRTRRESAPSAKIRYLTLRLRQALLDPNSIADRLSACNRDIAVRYSGTETPPPGLPRSPP